jgi:tRNA(Arg) A34 adenosine deaminase TadA
MCVRIDQPREQRKLTQIVDRSFMLNVAGLLHRDNVLTVDKDDRIALTLRRDDAPRPQTVYHDADYARFNLIRRGAPVSGAQPQFMQQAIALATENVVSGRGGPFGAVIVKDGEVLATGVNHVTEWNDPSAHAEIVAIREACSKLESFRLDGCDVYSSCEPCPMCLAALYWAHVRAIYFGNSAADAARIGFDDSFLYDELRKPLDQRRIPIENMLRDQAQESFIAWEASPKKVQY